MKRCKIASFLVAIHLLFASRLAFGSEGATFGGVIGGTDINNAYLPARAGLYLTPLEFYAYSPSIRLDGAGPIRVNATVNDLGLYSLYVYPFHLGGGTLATGVQAVYATLARDSFRGVTYHAEGWDNVYLDALVWSKTFRNLFSAAPPPNGRSLPPRLPSGLTLKLAYSTEFPVGAFERSRPFNGGTGRGDFFFIPNAAATYRTRPNVLGDATEFDLHLFYQKQARDDSTSYQSGQIINADFAVGEQLGRWFTGIAGAYVKQVTDDTFHDKIAGTKGDKLTDFNVGPVFQYAIPSLRSSIKFKIQLPVVRRNTVDATTAVLAWSFQL